MAGPSAPEPRPAAGSGALDAQALADMAASAIVRFLGGMGLVLVAVGAVEALAGGAGSQAWPRLRFGLLLVAGAAAGAWLQRRGQARAANAACLAVSSAALALFAWDVGLGVHTLALAAVAVLVTLAGAVAGTRAALVLAVLYVAFALGLAWAEWAGWLAGSAVQQQMPLRQRVIGHTMLAVGGALAAMVLQRVVGRALHAAAEERARLTDLLRIGSDWTWEMDEQARMTYISPSFEARTGRTVAEFMRIDQPGGPQVLQNEEAALLRADLEAQRAFRNRVSTFVCADGTRVVMRGTGEPVHDAQGRFTGWRGVSHDITAERAAEAERQRSEVLLNQLVQLSPDPIFVSRLKGGTVVLANAAFLAFLRRPREEVLGRNGLQLGLWRDAAELRRLGEALQRETVLRDFRTVAHDPDGRPHDFLLSGALFDWGGEQVSVINARDVTEFDRVRREAEAANEAKSAFLATMSHEIRTPLNGVLGLARLLQTPGLPEARRHEYLAHVVDAAEQLSGLVGDVLDLSKIEAGHLEIEHIEFDLPALVDNTYRSFAPLGRERGLRMGCRVDPAVPRRVRGDPVRLRQILSNYLANALKFTAAGSVELVVAAAGGGRVRLAVQDTGVGVRPEVRERLFRPFAQADSSTTRRFGGTGLGLSICRELARRMGGEVGVDSDGSSGSTFWAELVLEPVAAPADPAAVPAPAQPLAGRLILVAEDNPVNMLIVGAMLRGLGAEVLEADDGERAVALALSHASSLHAVLMDLHMPRVDGLAATRLLRAEPRTAALPVFALTAAVLERDRQQAEAAGMNGFIGKPVLEAELLRVLGAAG